MLIKPTQAIKKLVQLTHHTSIRNFRYSIEKETNIVLPDPKTIVNEQVINELLESTKEKAKDLGYVKQILQNARDRAILKTEDRCLPQSEFVQGLTLEEAATLLNVDSNNDELMNSLFTSALFIKEAIYGNRIVLFAPLYVSNYCTQSCVYCGFRGLNKEIERSKLSRQQLVEEVEALERLGHKRILMLAGESPHYNFEQFLEDLKLASSVKTENNGEIRRINVEIPSLSISDYRRLKATDCVGTVVLFQETYHRETYKKVHPFGMKSNYDYRLLTMDRAQIAGLDDVGLGVLYGLYDHKFETLAMLQHAQHLDHTYKAGPHTLSVPRLKPANDAQTDFGYAVNDKDFKKIVAILRCAVPYTGMILSTRESPEMRRDLLHLGVSQLSAGSKTDVGSYHKGENMQSKELQAGQFSLADHRTTGEVIRELIKDGYMPSFCTACYRNHRTGEAFMKIAKSGNIQNFCHPNSILTLAEYLHDYADPETKRLGWEAIEKEQLTIPSERRRESLVKKLKSIAEGKRDLYY